MKGKTAQLEVGFWGESLILVCGLEIGKFTYGIGKISLWNCAEKLFIVS